MRHAFISLLLTLVVGCNGTSVEKETSNRLVGSWQPVANFIAPTKVYGNVKSGWNPDNSFPAVSFRSDGTFFNPFGFVGTTLRYQVLNDHQLSFTDENNKATIYEYEFRSDTLITLTDCANQFYCGWKYVPQP